MTSDEEFISAVYRMAEGGARDLEGWRNAFTEDGAFTITRMSTRRPSPVMKLDSGG